MTLYPYNIKKTELSASETKTFPQNQTLLDMLTDAIEDEISDFGKYISLSEIISNKDDAEIIKSVTYDEYKHRRLFEEIYKSLTGVTPNITEESDDSQIENIFEEFTESFFDELEAVELYREIMSAFENTDIRDMIFEIITDEQSHADILNYMIAKYRK